MNTRYKDVIHWLENKAITEPVAAEQIVHHNIELVSAAFNKPHAYVHNLLNRDDFSTINPEEHKIVNFYFSTLRKWMR